MGTVRLVHAPLVNHWWQVTLYVTPRGLSTGSIPAGCRRELGIEAETSSGPHRVPRSAGERRYFPRRLRRSDRPDSRARNRCRRGIVAAILGPARCTSCQY